MPHKMIPCAAAGALLEWVNMKAITLTKSHLVLIVLLIIAAFLIGSLYTKVQYLEKGGGTAAAGTKPSKYKTFEDAMKGLAKDAKLDANKLVSCMTSGEKKAAIDADVAQGTTLGVNGTPAFYINGKLMGGAFPLELMKEVIDKELAGKGSTRVEDYSDSLQSAAKSGAFDPKPKTIALGNASTRGTQGAPITVVEFSDFQCPFCERAYPTVKQLLKDYDGKILLAYKQFPLVSIHPHAEKTAEASICAADQGKFWEFHDQLFEHQSDWASL